MSAPLSVDLTPLPLLVDRASAALSAARNSAEVLEAKELASLAYDLGKRAARLQRAKHAHDELIAATHRAQADALEIESRAKMRLADEYDAAQERGEVQGHGGARNFKVPDENVEPSVTDLGLTSKQIHEARQLRDAEEADPGVVRETLDALLGEGEEPTRTAVLRKIGGYRQTYSGDTNWHTPSEIIETARLALGGIDLDPASNEIAQETVRAGSFFTIEEDGLRRDWFGRVWLNPPYAQPLIGLFIDKLLTEVRAHRIEAAILLTHNHSDTAWFQRAGASAELVCLTRGRIGFVSPTRGSASPFQGQAFFYFGSDPERFRTEFAEIGLILRPEDDLPSAGEAAP